MEQEESKYRDTIAQLKKELVEKDSDIQKAATFGKQLLDDKANLTEQLHQILSENEVLKQEKYSLQLDLETQMQTVRSQSSESELINEQYESMKKKLEVLQKEKHSQNLQISHLTNENEELETNLQKALQGNSELNKKIVCKEQEIRSLQYKNEMSLNITLQQTLIEEDDIEYFKLQNVQLQEALAEVQFELKSAQAEESRLLAMVKELEEGIKDRDKEIKACTLEIKRASEMQAELQGEIEVLKLEQLDVNRRGNSVFGELDDRRKYVEKEYKLLENKYENMLVNFERNKLELSNSKGQMAILLSMTSRDYHTNYIKELEENVRDSKQQINNLNAKLEELIQSQVQKQMNLSHMLKSGDEYGYLKVMYEQAEKKIKSLEFDLSSHRMQNRADKDNLISTQQDLYSTQAKLDSLKIDNLKLKQELRTLTAKPDEQESQPEKQKKVIEVLPGYNLTPTSAKNLAVEMRKKEKEKIARSEDYNPTEYGLIDGEFQLVKKQTKSNQAILRDFNKVEKEEMGQSAEFSPEIRFAKETTGLNEENVSKPASYARYRTPGYKAKARNEANCKQQ